MEKTRIGTCTETTRTRTRTRKRIRACTVTDYGQRNDTDADTDTGIHTILDEDSAKKFFDVHRKRLESWGMKDVHAELFHVNENLSRITKFPVAEQRPPVA